MTDFNLKRPEDIIADAYAGDRVVFSCAKHIYTGEVGQLPHPGCKECAQVQLMLIFCRKKGDKQAALDELEAIIHALCELDEEGLMDYQSIKPEITITSED